MLPKKINVLGMPISIYSKIPKKILEKESFNGFVEESVYGVFSAQDSLIYINPKQDQEHQMRTLLHEISHVIAYRSGLKFISNWNDDLEEVLCEAVANTFYELLTKDGRFVECIIS